MPVCRIYFWSVVGDEQRFAFAVERLVITDLAAAVARGPQGLSFALNIVRDYGARGFQNYLGRAVVLFQANNLRVGKIFFKFENVLDVRAAPGIDALVLIADDADIVFFAGQHLHQLILRAVGVLVFVDEDVTEGDGCNSRELRQRSAGRRTASSSRSSKSRAFARSSSLV